MPKRKMSIEVNEAQFDHLTKFFSELSGGEPVPVHNLETGEVTMTRPFMSQAEKRRFEHGQREREKAKQIRFNARRDWDDDEIRTHFDCNPNMTVAQLAFMCGKTVDEVKKILNEENN